MEAKPSAKPRKIAGKYGTIYRMEVCVKGIRKSANFDTQSDAYKWAEETTHLLLTGQALPGEDPIGDMGCKDAVKKYTMAVANKKKATTRQSDQWAGSRNWRYLDDQCAWGGRWFRLGWFEPSEYTAW